MQVSESTFKQMYGLSQKIRFQSRMHSNKRGVDEADDGCDVRICKRMEKGF